MDSFYLRGIMTAGTVLPGGFHMDEQVIETATGLGYVELVEGTGARPKLGDSVSVHYTGWLKSGQKFDSSVDRGEPLVFPIGKGRVIKGWDEGVGTMKVGGKRKLIIPAHLGYGVRGGGRRHPSRRDLDLRSRAARRAAGLARSVRRFCLPSTSAWR